MHLIKQNYFLKMFLRTFDDTGIFLSAFHSRTTLKLNKISVNTELVKKVIPNLVKCVWKWLYSSGGSEEMWAWTFINTSWTLQYASEEILLSRLLEGPIFGLCFKKCWEVFEKLVKNNRLKDYLEKCMSNMVSGLLNLLQMMELLGLLIGLGLLEL